MKKKGTTRKSSSKKAPEKNEKKTRARPKGTVGGARPGSGRKPGVVGDKRMILERMRQSILEYGDKEIPVYENIRDKKGNIRRVLVTKAIHLIAMDKLVEHMMNSKDKRVSLQATEKLLERVVGKPVQPVENTEIDPKEQSVPTDPAMQKAMEIYQKERKRHGAGGT